LPVHAAIPRHRWGSSGNAANAGLRLIPSGLALRVLDAAPAMT
jgi:hypothetical protein